MGTRIAVQSGDGLVGRFGDTALLIPVYAPEEVQFVEELMATAEASAAEGALPGPVLARRIGELILRAGSGAVPSFGVVSQVEGGAVVLLHGEVDASIIGSSGEHRLSGRQAASWVDRVLRAPIDRLALTQADAQLTQVDPRSDLRVGVVPGAGFVMTPEGAGAEAAPPRATDGGTEGMANRASEPVPAAGAGARLATGPRPGPREESRPSRLPRRAAATVAGTSAPAELVGADGSRTPLDREYVVGREPGTDVAVVSGTASSIQVDDPDGLVSRVHAHLWVERGVVFVRDASSANGTFLAAPGAQDWTRVSSEGTELPLGWSVRVGGQIFTLEKAMSLGSSQ